jgi:excisionase family DNA binding protein
MDKFNTNSLLTRDEAADFLGVSSTTLALWKSTKRYGLPVVMVGRLPKYRYSDLLEFIEARTVNKPNTLNNNLKYDRKGD